MTINLLKPAGYLMHIQKLEILPTLYLCVLYLSENKQQLLAYITLTLCRRVGHLIKYPLVPGRFKCFECSTQ